jgi:3',5'-cyclic AMP phosphodiesterase CpdA
MFDYSPYAIDFDEENTNVNIKNISKIINQKNTDNIIAIAFTGDTHREFDEFEKAITSINKLNNEISIDFVTHMGDIADFGLPQQYLWGNSYLLKLNLPYIVTLGNHDLVGNGGDAYKVMYGDYNFSFIYDSIKFVVANTNGMEFNFNGKVPDINWLDAQLKPSNNFRKAVILIHVPPMSVDYDPSLENAFSSTVAKYGNVICVIHGHTHSHSVYVPYTDSISYAGIYSVKNMKFNLLKIENDKFVFSTYDF